MRSVRDHIDSIKNKPVLVRCNFDVPISAGKVQDTTRLEDALETINLLKQNCPKIILLAHSDRPGGKFDQQKTLQPVADSLGNLLSTPVNFIPFSSDISPSHVKEGINLLDNLRFWPGEQANVPEFSQTLSSLGEIYVNEAFANCHRNHASITGLPELLDSFAGVSLTHEIEVLTKAREEPQKPLVVIVGGAKLKTKHPLINAYAQTADHILVGGKLALDLKTHSDLAANVKLAQLTPNSKDITKESAQEFAQVINQAGTVIWNGTMGIFEEQDHRVGTTIVAQAVNSTKAFTIVGGGDTESALSILNMEKGIDHISSGGGAMLKYLVQGTLIGLQALKS